MSELLKKIWNLRTHPFRPETDADGNPIDPNVWNSPLDPIKEPRVISFYHDVYDWRKSSLIRQISPQDLFTHFPTKTQIDDTGALMVMITGYDNTGRESLQNLILHKIKAQYNKPPIVVKVTLVINLLESLKRIRTLFAFTYSKEERRPTRKGLSAAVTDAANVDGELSADAHATLFQMWKNLIAPECARPLVLLISGVDDFDLWRQVYNSVSALFDFIIVVTKNEVRAETTDVLLRQNQRNSAVIKARPLTADAAETYLRTRLASQRIGQTNEPLAPFATDVIAALYEPGASAEPRETVRWSVGWLNKTLARVLDDHLQILRARENAGTNVNALPQEQLLIDAVAIRAARERMNQGN
jgi:hypothetical protein